MVSAADISPAQQLAPEPRPGPESESEPLPRQDPGPDPDTDMETDQPAHLRLLNPDPKPHAGWYKVTPPATVFHPFPRLPTELRLDIWKRSLQRHRLVKVFIHNKRFRPEVKLPRPYHYQNDDGDDDDDDENIHHYAIVVGNQALSKLLHVNRESRQIAREFYRVAFPCWFISKSDEYEARAISNQQAEKNSTASQGMFYFNPEWDYLHLVAEPFAADTLVEFIHFLKTKYDPRGVGLLNLAFGGNDLVVTETPDFNPATLDPAVRASFVQTLIQLKGFYSLHYTATGRQCEGPRSGYSAKVWFNRAMPIMPACGPPGYDLVARDPRENISRDLRRTFTDLLQARVLGQLDTLFLRFGVTQEQRRVKIQFLVAFQRDDTNSIVDRQSAEKYLRKEEEYWKWLAVGGYGPGISEEENRAEEKAFANIKWPPLTLPEEDLEKVPRPAMGFWLFPIECLQKGVGNTFVHDLSDYWPELALVRLT